MDAPLVLALGCGYLVRVRRGGVLAPGWGAAAADGGLLALAFLARVDTLPLVAAAFVLMAVAARERHGRWTDLFLRACVFVALAAPYLVVGERRFGSWVPISARLKSAFPRLDPVQSLAAIRGTSLNPADQASFLVALVLALGVCVAWLPGLMAAPSTRRSGAARVGGRDGVLLLLAMYLVLRLGYMLLFSRYDVQGSYAILAHVFNVLVALRAVDAVGHPGGKALAPRLRLLGASALLGLGLLLFSGKVLTTTDRWRRMVTGAGVDDATIGRAIATATGRHDVLYGGAFGIAGFFADRAWINGDGVINTLAYQEALRDRRLNDYLAARHVNRVVFVTDRRTGPYAVAVRSGLFGTSDTLRVTAGTEQARFPTLRAGGGEVVLAVWEPKNAPERALRAAARVVHARGADGDGGSHLSR
jgi:hypothetical protein